MREDTDRFYLFIRNRLIRDSTLSLSRSECMVDNSWPVQSIRIVIVMACTLFVIAITSFPTLAQRTAGDQADLNPYFVIDTPVAGILPKSVGAVEAYIYPEGGILLGLSYGLMKNMNVGFSFGGTNILGSGGIVWNKLPGIMIRYRVVDEDASLPGIVAGFDSQGKDGYREEWHQYAIKSPGLFVSVSKNYKLYGTISFHGAVTYTFERYDGDRSPNVFIGMEKSIGSLLSFLSEYNFFFDGDNNTKGFWNGMLNIGLRVSTNLGFNLDFYFKNLLTKPFYNEHVTREFKIQYVRQF